MLLLVLCGVAVASVDECISINKAHLHIAFSETLLSTHCEWVLAAAPKDAPSLLILNDLAPFTVLTEDPFLDEVKRLQMKQFVDKLVSSCTDVTCIVRSLNANVWNVRGSAFPPIVFEAATANKPLNSYSVEQTWAQGSGSCTAMAVFLITALRFAGVPARLVGTPHWNLDSEQCPQGDASEPCGNHNWVEVMTPSGWSWVDQRRPDKQVLPLNESWFFPEWTSHSLVPHMGNHSIYAASFLPISLEEDYPVGNDVETAEWFPMVWDWSNHDVHAWDVSAVYKRRVSNILEIEVT